MEFSLSTAVDAAILVLLCVTIGYAVVLNRALNRLRDHRSELATGLAALEGALQRAEGALKTMHDEVAEHEPRLMRRVTEARKLADELDLLSDRGEKSASRLERGLSKARPVLALAEAPSPSAAPAEPELRNVEDALAAAVESLRRGGHA